MGDGKLRGNILTVRKHLLTFFAYGVFSLLSSVVEGLSISILPLVLRVILSSSENIQIIPALKPFQRYIETMILSHNPFVSIRNISLLVALIFVAKFLVNSAKKFSILHLQEAVSRDIRNRAFDSLINADMESIKNVRSGDIISRLTTEINNIKLAIRDGIGSAVGDGLNLMVFVFLAITSAPILSVFAWGILLLAAISGWVISRAVKRRALKAMKTLGDITSFLSSVFDGLKTVKSLNFMERIKDDFHKLSEGMYKKYLKLEFSAALAPVMSESIVGISASVILLLAGFFIYRANLVSPDAFIVFLAASLSTIRPLKLVFQSIAYIQTARVSLKRINEIYNLPGEVWGYKDPSEWKVLEIKNLKVVYSGKEILSIPNLKIKRGERISIIGKSGSGKTTFAELLMGFVKPYRGEILLDGVSLYEYDIVKWRNLTGFVPQEPYIFDWSLRENIGDNPERIMEKLSLGHLTSRLDENVVNLKNTLSGGEKQRISIARVLLRKPSILIMDEPTSALDAKSEERLRYMINSLPENTTLIVMAHKPSTVLWGNRILVFKDGRIVCDGDVKALGRNCKDFVELMKFLNEQ